MMKNWEDLEGSGRDQIEVISWNLPGGTKDKHENSQAG
jgi:hypothetical protein